MQMKTVHPRNFRSMRLRFVCISVFLFAAIPSWAETRLVSAAVIPKAVTQPPPTPLTTEIDRNDNLPVSLSIAASANGCSASASAFAQSDYGVLRASAFSSIGLDNRCGVYDIESGAASEFFDDFYLNVPAGQQLARMVFSYNVSQTHNAGPFGGESLDFAAIIISRPGWGGTGLLGVVHCGTDPGNPGVLSASGSGFVYNLDIPLSAICTLDAPVTAGLQVKLEVNAFIQLSAAGFSTVSSLDASHTVKVISTGWVDSSGVFTAAPFTGASGAIYPPAGPPVDTAGPITSNVVVSPNPVAINTSSTLTAAVSDATTGGSNVASAYYSVNGSTPAQMVLTPSGAVTTQASASLPPFSVSNIYNVCVHGTDVPGNTAADSCFLLPVYDPAGSFVTGGGQIASPAGADLLNTSAAGIATFGFVSKYLPGRNTPSGNLEFQFKNGNLDFKSTSMDWLVVTGEPRAKFHGVGTVNGTNVCNFEVDAWAGSFTGNVDAFGLKISSCSNGGDRYSLPATALTKGSIIIHK